MKIMIITEHFPPKLSSASQRIKNISQTFSEISEKNIVNVFVYNSKKSSQGWKRKEKINNVLINSYDRTILPRIFHYGDTINPLTFIVFFLLLIKQAKSSKSDFLFVTVPPHFIFPFATYLVSKIIKKPFVIDIRDHWKASKSYNIKTNSNFLKKFMVLLDKILEKLFIFTCKKSLLISTVYPTIRKYLQKKNVKTPIELIPNGINFEELNKQKEQFNKIETLEKYNIPYESNKKYIIYIGNESEYYDIYIFIKAIQNLTYQENIHLIIVGRHPKLRKRLDKEKKLRNVSIVGSLPHDQLLKILLASDAAIYTLEKNFPNPDAALGTKVLEYIGCNLPILSVAPREALTSSIIKENDIGISLTWENTDKLKHSINEILSSKSYKENIKKYQQSFYKKYNREFNNKRLYKKIEEMINKKY